MSYCARSGGSQKPEVRNRKSRLPMAIGRPSDFWILRSDFRARRRAPFFAGLVVLAGEFHPIPFRTRPLKPPAPMVLRPKPRESRSLPVLPRTVSGCLHEDQEPPRASPGAFCLITSPACGRGRKREAFSGEGNPSPLPPSQLSKSRRGNAGAFLLCPAFRDAWRRRGPAQRYAV